MANGKLILFRKDNFSSFATLDILSTFNIEDNLNETPSNMKVKAITSNSFREEFEVNTVALHEDTNTWWVIKSDESTYLMTGEYEHEIQLVEFLEYYSFRHLPNCAFAPNTYTLDQMLIRLFQIAKLTVGFNYPSFLDKDKVMSFMSFENFTVANAVKNIARAINAIPKFYVDFPFFEIITTVAFSQSPPSSPTLGMYWFKTDTNQLFLNTNGWSLIPNTLYGTSLPIVKEKNIYFVNTSTQQLFLSQDLSPILTFVNRNGLDLPIVETLNTQFPIAYEKNTNSSDQFLTRSVSNITNAKSSFLTVAPKQGGFKNVIPNALEYNTENLTSSRVLLPSKIEKVEWVRIIPRISVGVNDETDNIIESLFEGYYLNPEKIKQDIISQISKFNVFTIEDLQSLVMPQIEDLFQINLNDALQENITTSLLGGKFTLKSKFDFDTSDEQSAPYDTIQKVKDKTIHWLPFTNEIVMAKSFQEGLLLNANPRQFNQNGVLVASKTISGNTERIRIFVTGTKTTGFFTSRVPNDEVLIQVGYYPIADIKVSIDNDNDAQDEKFFNQSGKVIDAVSVSKLITSHTNDSVDGTKIRNARYESPDYDYTDILPLGQLVRDNNQTYVITQRSIDGHIKTTNQYYNVIYTLSRNRVARSENIVADSSVISYKTPDDNLVSRSQLYKDYIELSLTNGNHDNPYLNLRKILNLDTENAGSNFDYTVIAKNDYGSPTTTIRYVKNPIVFDLHRAKLMNVNWQDNNVLGFRLDSTGSTYVQTPIVYTDSLGKATNFELLFLDSNNIESANKDYNFPTVTDLIVPFSDLTQVPSSFYTSDVVADGRFSIRIQEPNYTKDPFEIPVFEYMLQANDDYDAKGNVIVGNDLFSTFTGDIRYHYVINNTTRFTAENADKLYTANAPSSATDRRVVITRSGTDDEILDLDILSTHPSTDNTSEFTHIGIYATDGTNVKFLFAINDYATPTSWKDITLQGKTLTWSSTLQTAGIDKVWYNPNSGVLNVAELVGGIYEWVEKTRVVSNAQPALTVAQEYWVAPIAQIVYSRFNDYANIRLFINNWKI